MHRISWLSHITAWLVLAGVTAWVWADSDRAFRRMAVPTNVVVRRDVVYRNVDGHRLALDIYRPPGDAASSPRPAILAIHGGSWSGGSKRLFRPGLGNPHPTAVRLAEAGYVVIAPDYRTARPGSPGWPSALEDLREAVRWTRRHAPELGVDPGRIAAFGQSAGGHLAVLLGALPDPLDRGDGPSRVQAVIDLYGPTDLERLPEMRVRPLEHEPVRLFLGAGTPDLAELARDASPIRHIDPADVPMLVIHGTGDLWVPIEQSEELVKRLEAAGVMHRRVRVDGALHGFDASLKISENADLLAEILAFLRDVWNAPLM